MANILFTGCNAGVGLAGAKLLARNGHHVFASMRNTEHALKLEAFAEDKDLPITILPLNVNIEDSVNKAVVEIIDKKGRIDVLINNASIGTIASVEEAPLSLYRSVMETNFYGTLRCIKAVLPYMTRQKSGHIINVSSVEGKVFSNFHSVYSTSKAAVEALSESLAQEVLPFNIKVSILETEAMENLSVQASDPLIKDSKYSNIQRCVAFLEASQDQEQRDSAVSETLADLVDGKVEGFRVSSHSEISPLLEWRLTLSDEEWIRTANTDNEDWASKVKNELKVDVSPHLKKS